MMKMDITDWLGGEAFFCIANLMMLRFICIISHLHMMYSSTHTVL
jgi:hypothetical protein